MRTQTDTTTQKHNDDEVLPPPVNRNVINVDEIAGDVCNSGLTYTAFSRGANK